LFPRDQSRILPFEDFGGGLKNFAWLVFGVVALVFAVIVLAIGALIAYLILRR
jgi:hypothetical protein